MTPSWRNCCWQLRLASVLAMGGAIASSGDCALAQSKIVPDGTLLTPQADERSIVIPNFRGLPVEAIGGGAIRGANLFHSFQEFNVSLGRGAYFFSPNVQIQNILARVTGSNPSKILGTIGTFGNSKPNLFLINPNGIIFGPSSSLDVGGSFVATTANAVRLGDTGLFSASEPASSNLLSVNPSAFFFNALSHQAIVNSSSATSTVLGSPISGLQVNNSQSLLLVGGDVSLDGGKLYAPGGRVELGGVAGAGTVGLNVDSNNLSLSFPSGVDRADVSLTNGSRVDVTAGGGGSIAVNARNLYVLGGSGLQAGIASDSGSVDSKAGDIEINTTEAITLANGSFISNEVLPRAVGKGGEINITAGSLSLTNGATLSASTSGQGDAGSVFVQANGGVSLVNSNIFSTVEAGAVGKGGDINIRAGLLSLSNGAQLQTLVREASNTIPAGYGNAGNVNIDVSNAVTIAGVNNGISSGILSTIGLGAVGKGGDINIRAGSFSLTNGAELLANTLGQGNAGSVRIQASGLVFFDGVGSNRQSSGAGSEVGLGAMGKGGDVNVTAGSLSVTNGAELDASTFGRGDAGSVTINASGPVFFDGVGSNGFVSSAGSNVNSRAVGKGGDVNVMAGSLSLTNGAQMSSSTFGYGNAGNVNVDVRNAFTLDGFNIITVAGVNSANLSSVQSQVGPGAVGEGGNIRIKSGSLSLNNSAGLLASTSGQGNTGNIFIQANDSVSLTNLSQIRSNVEPGGTGNGGDIDIQARLLSLTNGAQVNDAVFRTVGNFPGGQGKGGNIRVNASDSVNISGVSSFKFPVSVVNPLNPSAMLQTEGFSSGLFVSTERGAVGQGGNITVNTGDFRIADGAIVNAQTLNPSDAGNITINANTFEAVGGGQVLTITRNSGKAGDITLNAKDSITISGSDPTFADRFARFSRDVVNNEGSASGLFANTDSNSVGNGGSIALSTTNLNLTNGALVSAQSQGTGTAGNITINARQTLSANNSNITTAATQSTGGTINITAKDIRLFGNSNIKTNVASGAGNGGNIKLTANSILAFDDSDILAFARDGKGGNITFDTPAFFGSSYRPAPRGTDPASFNGNNRVDVNASGAVSGVVTLPDVSSLQNSLTRLPQTLIDTNTLLANSCIARSPRQGGSFQITGAGGLPTRPKDASVSPYPTGSVRSIPSNGASSDSLNSSIPSTSPARPWKLGNPIVEPQGVYRLPNGHLVLSRECSQ